MDWNNDGLNDIISGDTDGNVWFFENTGTSGNPELAEGVKIEAAGKIIRGKNKIYKKVGDSYEVDRVVEGNHDLAETYSKIHVADWNKDGKNDLLIGHNNTVLFYENTGTAGEPALAEPVLVLDSLEAYSRPAPYVFDWDNDGVQDLLTGNDRGKIHFYRNTGTNKDPELAEAEELTFTGEDFGGRRLRLDITDWNNDGLIDVLVGTFTSEKKGDDYSMSGHVWLFRGKEQQE